MPRSGEAKQSGSRGSLRSRGTRRLTWNTCTRRQAGNAIVVTLCQFLAMVVISIGMVKALGIFLKDALTPGRSAATIKESRLELGRSLVLALGFLIGASILKTTLAPTWTDIGQLAAIIAIRTILNYFLLHDISVEWETSARAPTPFTGFSRRKRDVTHATGEQ